MSEQLTPDAYVEELDYCASELRLHPNTRRQFAQVRQQLRDRLRTSRVVMPGVAMLFSGPRGSGKRQAAVTLAREFGRPLLRADLERIVDKYIGETEKNLRDALQAAAADHAVLFFDEADSLFGRRTDVKDSHDRYANQAANYLLQRVGEFTAPVIITTLDQANIDPAFVRQFLSVVSFRLPD